MLNLISFLLGLCAWALGAAAIVKKGSCPLSFGSFTLCGGALALQFFEIRRRIALSDWSALMDTADALATAAAILLAVTVALNLIALWQSRRVR